MNWQWNERAAQGCAHGYVYGDWPLVCAQCGHACELHPEGQPCQGFECDCQGWADDDDGDGG